MSASQDSFSPHHLSITAEQVRGNAGKGRLFFLPGSDGRASRISERFSDCEALRCDRQLNVYLGRLQGSGGPVDVGVVATGMGCPSLDIVVSELVLLGARSFIRVGTAGSLRPDMVRVGDLVVATGAVRDEATSDAYVVREYPAVADPEVVASLQRAAFACGVEDHTYAGIIHTKDSLFAREMGAGPRSAENKEYLRQLRSMGVLASEMESAHLFVLANVYSTAIVPLSRRSSDQGQRVRSGAVLAIIGDDTAFADTGAVVRVEEEAIEVALQAAVDLLGGGGSSLG